MEIKVKDKIIKYIKKCDSLLGVKLFPLVTTIIPIIIWLYSFNYSIKCQNTYNIPSKYFSFTTNDIMLYGLLIILIIGTILYNYFFYKKTIKENQIIDKTLYPVGAVIPGLTFTYIEFILFYLIFINSKFNPILPNITWLIIFGVILIINILSFWHISDTSTKPRKITYFITTILSVIIKLTVILAFLFAFINANPIRGKYETTMINNENYVILSEYNQNYLVVKYESISTKTIFYTSKYQLIDEKGLIVQLSSFENIECK